MPYILVCSQKGGTGKTLISDELLYSFERTGEDASFIDMDTQRSAMHNETPDDKLTDLVVVDLPGYVSEGIEDYLAASDVIVLPCLASSSDQGPLEYMLELLRRYAPDKPVVIVHNRWMRFRLDEYFDEYLTEKGFLRPNEKVVRLVQSQAFALAHATEGTSVASLSRLTKGQQNAAQSLISVINTIREAAGLEPEKLPRLNKGEENV